jgi:non-ribosomal peptide synthetase component F
MQPELLIYTGSLSDDLKQAVTIPVAEYMELTAAEADPELISQIRKGCMDTDPLYAICTSGSTGTPKGVLISHRSVMDFIPVFVRTFHLSEEDIFGNQAPFDFDVSVKDIYSSLYLGATVQIIPRVCFSMPKKLVELLDEKQVTVIIWAVSALCIAAGLNAFKHRVPGALKKIMFSGEVMPIKMLNIWRRYFPDAMFVNLYGPT